MERLHKMTTLNIQGDESCDSSYEIERQPLLPPSASAISNRQIVSSKIYKLFKRTKDDPSKSSHYSKSKSYDSTKPNVDNLPSSHHSKNKTNDSSATSISCLPNRQPFYYEHTHSYNLSSDIQVMLNRHKYYNKLAPPDDQILKIPNHVLPSHLLVVRELPKGKQSSLVTIFSIWNTMVGTSLLSLPWAVGQAGLAVGIFLILLLCGLTCYTCYLVLISSEQMMKERPGHIVEFSDVCKKYLGRIGELCSIIFSIMTLVGAIVTFWVLMTNFLESLGNYFYSISDNSNNSSDCFNNDTVSQVCCDPHIKSLFKPDLFYKLWTHKTVSAYLLLVFLPLVNLKSPTFFTKFNALGTLSILYIFIFIIYKSCSWRVDRLFPSASALSGANFPILSGILSLSYFIHSCIMSITRNQSQPKNNSRDLIIAYIFVMLTYLTVGVIFYITFPLEKSCIHDNFFDNFSAADILTLIGRFSLLFQLATVYPLICYIIRVQFLHTIFGSVYPGFHHVFLLNSFLLLVCVLIAIFYPKVGDIIRYVGAFTGLGYIFTLPCLVYLAQHWHNLTFPKAVFHVLLIVIGIANFIGQFVVTKY